MTLFKNAGTVLSGLLLSLALAGCTAASVTPGNPSTLAPAETTAITTTAPVSLRGAAAAQTDTTLTLEDMLTYALQDEYLAYGEYDWITRTYSNPRPFSNIIQAEQSHIRSLLPLFDTYGVALPEKPAADSLPHPVSVSAAVLTGIQAEVDNIAMYAAFLKQDLPSDVRAVFEELKKASGNHLDAFEKSKDKL